MSPGFGIPWRIDGPPPLAPVYGLLQAADGDPAVRINSPVDLVDVDSSGATVERWINGVEVYPYPPGVGLVWDPCASASPPLTKDAGDDEIPLPRFGAMTVYFAETCTARGVWDQAAFQGRATAALAAVEGATVERELLTGTILGAAPDGNPFLADGNGTFPWGDGATSIVNAIAVLENEIAASGRRGLIHMSPGMATFAAVHHLEDADPRGPVLRTVNGTVVIPGYGYAEGATPVGHPAPGATEEWIYATGPIDIRRSDIFIVPDTVAAALDRGLGATDGRPNSITYRAERYVLVDWDTIVQAAVLVDRCSTECGTPPS